MSRVLFYNSATDDDLTNITNICSQADAFNLTCIDLNDEYYEFDNEAVVKSLYEPPEVPNRYLLNQTPMFEPACKHWNTNPETNCATLKTMNCFDLDSVEYSTQCNECPADKYYNNSTKSCAGGELFEEINDDRTGCKQLAIRRPYANSPPSSNGLYLVHNDRKLDTWTNNFSDCVNGCLSLNNCTTFGTSGDREGHLKCQFRNGHYDPQGEWTWYDIIRD